MDGIYILANDAVFDQLVALLNSIEVNAGKSYPVAILAYDARLERVRQEVAHRSSVTLIDDFSCFSPWLDFAAQAWETHPTAMHDWRSRQQAKPIYRAGMHHRFYAFDPNSPFDRSIYLDADILVLNSLEPLFQCLDEYDLAVYDFQYKDISHVFNPRSSRLNNAFQHLGIPQPLNQIFCAGLYASRRNLFNDQQRQQLLDYLRQGDGDLLYPPAPDQSLLNYMVLKSGCSITNLARDLPATRITGCCVTSPHFEVRDRLAYDHQKRLTYLHYIGLPMQLFEQVCQGKNIDFPYRDLFLDYRYLHDPQARPQLTGSAKSYGAPLSIWQRALRKIGLSF